MKNRSRNYLRQTAGILILLAFVQTVFAQQTATAPKLPANGVNYKLDSKLMGREMPYRVAFPLRYLGEKDARFPVVYLLHGLSGHYDNWWDKTKLNEYVQRFGIVIVMPEGNNGWYTDSVSTQNDKYESYIIKELIPEIDAKFRTIADREHRVIAGLSMGGYGAIKFGLKYPEMFTLVGSFSGALGAAGWTEKNAGTIAKSMDSVFGADEGSDARKANDVFKMIREITPEKVKALPYIFQSCGTEDFLIKNNQDFLVLLNEKKVPHEFREHPGIHDWIFWDDQVREFLDVAERRLKK